MSAIFAPDGFPLLEGQILKQLKLAETLDSIAVDGADSLYTGSLASGLVLDIAAWNGIITQEDLSNYTALV